MFVGRADATLDIQAVLGFSGTFRLDHWTPLTITLSNHGNDLSGRLEVGVIAGDEFQGDLFTTTHRRALELPADSRKRFHFTVFPQNPTQPLMIRVRSAGGAILARHELDLRSGFSDARLILVLSRDADLDYLNDGDGENLRVLYPHPQMLPEHWQGYDGVAVVVIHGMSLEQLSARQFEALKRWLAGGGAIALAGGPDYALLRTPRLAGLAPALPTGIEQLAEQTITSENHGANGILPVPAGAPRSFDVHRLTHIDGRVLYRAGERPLIIEQQRGLGRVLYLTFDIARVPFAGWSGMKPLWLDSLRLPPPPPIDLQPARTKLEHPAIGVIRSDPEGFPKHGTVLVFLALYLGILATAYHLARMAAVNRRLLVWMTWASPVVFLAVAYLLFGPLNFARGEHAITLATIEPFPASPYARLNLDLGIYSQRRYPPSPVTSLRFDYDGIEPVLLPTHQGATRNWVFGQGLYSAVQPGDEREYTLHLLSGQDIIAYSLSGSVTGGAAEALQLQLDNASGQVLNHAWLIIGEHLYALGRIGEDAHIMRSFDAGAAQRLQTDTWRGLLDETIEHSHAMRIMLKRALARRLEQQKDGARDALLIGFTRSPLRPGMNSLSWQRIDLALVWVSLPLTSLPEQPETGEHDSS